MKRYLLPNSGNFYKANMHCHTDISDGKLTPEEIKKLYMEMGYSIVAYTDHDVFITHNDLNDGNFLALNGFEIEVNEFDEWPKQGNIGRATHLCFIALDKDNSLQPCWHRYKYFFGNAYKNSSRVNFDVSKPDYEREYSSECINDIISIMKQNGFFVTYNHPGWSLEDYSVYMSYDGFDAMEMFNGGSISEGYIDYNPRVYDDMLRGGKTVYCVGGDDNHNHREKGTRIYDAGKAFTVIKTSSLEYGAVADALKNGDFYCSDGGPEIRELYIEDNRVHIKCAPADIIRCTYSGRRGAVVYDETGEGVCEATFNIYDFSRYLRITVIDKFGRTSCTNAYFTEELLK